MGYLPANRKRISPYFGESELPGRPGYHAEGAEGRLLLLGTDSVK